MARKEAKEVKVNIVMTNEKSGERTILGSYLREEVAKPIIECLNKAYHEGYSFKTEEVQ